MRYPLVQELADDGVSVSVTCRVLGFSKQAFYKWQERPFSDRDWDDALLLNSIVDVHRADPEFGYRLISDELNKQGYTASENRVQRLCQTQSVRCRFYRRRAAKRPGPAVHDDLVERKFVATGANQVWVGDITEHWTREGKLYLCSFKDLWSNRLVGYSINSQMTADLAVQALDNAVTQRDCDQTIVHTDRGSQFRSTSFVEKLSDHGLRGSMGRVGAAGDNAPAESFFSLLQNNVLDRQRWETRNQLREAIVYWIEATYHRRRKQRCLGKRTPIQYEQQAA